MQFIAHFICFKGIDDKKMKLIEAVQSLSEVFQRSKYDANFVGDGLWKST